jgi:CHAT domain-containing protein
LFCALLAVMEKLVRASIALASFAISCQAQEDAALRAAMAAGMSTTSSAEQRTAMHRATQVLIEHAVERKEFLLAASYDRVERENYRNLDHDYEAALRASEAALEHLKTSGSLETMDLFYEGLARDYLALSRPAEALANFRLAQERENGIVTVTAAWVARGVVQAAIALGNVEIARPEVTKLLASKFQDTAFLAQSDVQIADGQFDAALVSIKQAQDAGASPLDVLKALTTVNLLATRSLPYDQAISLSRRIELEFSGTSIGPFIEETVAFRRRLAGDTAGTLYDKTAELENARRANDVPRQVEALSSLALLYRSLNSISDQIVTLEEARKLASPSLVHLRILNQLGDAYLSLSKPRIGSANECFSEAVRDFETAVQPEWRAKAAAQYGLALLGVARVNFLDEDAEQGRRRMLDALNGIPKAARFEKSDVLVLLARMERDQHQLPAASAYYAKAISDLHDGGWPTYEAVARVEYAHFLLTNGLSLNKSLEDAEVQLVAAELPALQLNLAETQWRIGYERGVLAEAKGNPIAALAAYRASIAKLESVRAEISNTGQRQTYLDRKVVQDLYSRAFALVAQPEELSELWDLMERAKARAFLDSLGGNRFHSPAAGAEARVSTLQDRLTNVKLELQPGNRDALRSSGQAPSNADLQSLERDLQQARQTAELAKSRSSNAAAAHPLPLKELYKFLPPKTALIEFGLIQDGLLAVVTARNGGKLLVHRVNIEVLRENVSALTNWLDKSDSGVTSPALQFVSEHVLAPFWPSIGPGIDHLIVVPTGFLSYIPFPALRTEGDRMLIDSVAVSYLPSASVLQFVSSNSRKTGKVFLGAIGNASTGRPPLPGTLDEVNSISKIYPAAERADEGTFTHDRARRALLEDDVVHFATHAELSESSPMLSKIITAPASGEPGQLSVYELPAMAIRARIVVLSACQTAGGNVSNGDEIPGLTRAMLSAGADTVVSSLWHVSDGSTAILMREFHRQLQRGADPSDALRTAELRVREKFPEPHFWAPFIVTGAN